MSDEKFLLLIEQHNKIVIQSFENSLILKNTYPKIQDSFSQKFEISEKCE